MGANASTAVPLYASGQVLDAARLNLTNCGVPVFSGTATRDSSFNGSGEKVLAEGQLCYLEDTNAVQYYDSAAWQSVAGGGMTLLSTTTLTGASTTVSGIDQTYTALQIYILNAYSATNTGYVRCYINSDSTSGNYGSSYQRFRSGATLSNDDTFAWSGWPFHNSTASNFTIVSLPNYASSTVKKVWSSFGSGLTDTSRGGFFGSGMWDNANAISSLQFINNAGSWAAGTVLIYGVK